MKGGFHGTLGTTLNPPLVCYPPKVNQQAADLACRQMGYTNAKTYNGIVKNSSNVTWLNGIQCGRSAQCNCLNGCFQYPLSRVSNIVCSGGYLYIECVFDTSKASTAPAGNEKTCSSFTTTSCMYSNPVPVIVAVVVVVLIIIAIVSSIITVVVCSLCFHACSKKRREGYISGN